MNPFEGRGRRCPSPSMSLEITSGDAMLLLEHGLELEDAVVALLRTGLAELEGRGGGGVPALPPRCSPAAWRERAEALRRERLHLEGELQQREAEMQDLEAMVRTYKEDRDRLAEPLKRLEAQAKLLEERWRARIAGGRA